jgi:hypothetical protein
MNRILRGVGGGAVAALGFAAMATMALAQMPEGPPSNDAGQQTSGYGYQMMEGYPGPGGYPGMGPGMMGGWGGGQGPGARWSGEGFPVAGRLAGLKNELNITAGEADAWNTYAAAVTAAHGQLRDGIRALWQSAANGEAMPDQRFAAMDKMVALMKQGYEQEKKAADALMPHLTPYQQGQAKETLPGLAAWGPGSACGPMWGGGMGW